MKDYLYLGPVPPEEPAAQIGAPEFARQNEIECRVWMRMLRRRFPVPEGLPARFSVKRFEHDFGTYREVVLVYEAHDQRACDFAAAVDRARPTSWDERALVELAWFQESYRYRSLVNAGRITWAQVPAVFLHPLPPEALPSAASLYATRPLPEEAVE